MFFNESRPDRAKRAAKHSLFERREALTSAPVPTAKSYEFLSHDDLVNKSLTLTADVESYVNYFIVSFMCVETGKVVYFECQGDQCLDGYQRQALAFILYRHKIVGFNSANYDLPMIALALQGVPPFKIKEVSNRVINDEMRSYQVWREFQLPALHTNHIDIMDVAPLEASLKLYAARLHCERLQDLPYAHDAFLTLEQMGNVRDYNVNDLIETSRLYKFLKPQIELREVLSREYNIDLRSRSDAQIAEAVIGSELRKLGVNVSKPKIEAGFTFQYEAPAFLAFKTPQFQHAFETIKAATFTVEENGYVKLPKAVAQLSPQLGLGTYKLGLGGLHSSEKSVGYVADASTLIIDRDVASYYPAIILNNRFFPPHLTEAYLEVYRILTQRRLKAKKDGDKTTADSLKIVINGGFGKLGDPTSIFYGPRNLIHVTLTGQLSLLMLIEMIELAGIPVISANTDGIVIKCPADRYTDLETVIIAWEEQTGFVTEETRYKSIWSRDVNNYIAVKEDGKCKMKGVFAEVGSALNSPLSKNPEAYIVSMAVQDFLANGTPVAETIMNHGAAVKTEFYPTPLSRFVAVKRVTGGAFKGDTYLGKVVRWYYARGEEGAIQTVRHGSTVGKTEGAKPLMTLTSDMPADLDYDWYINEANETLYDVGRYKRAGLAKLFD